VSEDDRRYTHYPGWPEDTREGYRGPFNDNETLQSLLDKRYWMPLCDPDLMMDIGL
jgi:hypothetical protein